MNDIRLLNFYGDDAMVVHAASISYGKEESANPAKLLQHLANNKHLTPFRHPQLTFGLHIPVFVARQWGKHQIGCTWSEKSKRYTKDGLEFWIPDATRSKNRRLYQEAETVCRHLYTEALNCGDKPEVARTLLPQSMYVDVIWTASLLAVINFLEQRLHYHAQIEIREYAKIVYEITRTYFPMCIDAFFGGRKYLLDLSDHQGKF